MNRFMEFYLPEAPPELWHRRDLSIVMVTPSSVEIFLLLYSVYPAGVVPDNSVQKIEMSCFNDFGCRLSRPTQAKTEFLLFSQSCTLRQRHSSSQSSDTLTT